MVKNLLSIFKFMNGALSRLTVWALSDTGGDSETLSQIFNMTICIFMALVSCGARTPPFLSAASRTAFSLKWLVCVKDAFTQTSHWVLQSLVLGQTRHDSIGTRHVIYGSFHKCESFLICLKLLWRPCNFARLHIPSFITATLVCSFSWWEFRRHSGVSWSGNPLHGSSINKDRTLIVQ